MPAWSNLASSFWSARRSVSASARAWCNRSGRSLAADGSPRSAASSAEMSATPVGGWTRLAMTAPTWKRYFPSCAWNCSASSMVSACGEVTSTKPAWGLPKSCFTWAARSLKPSYMPDSESMKSASSRSVSSPVKRLMPLMSRPPPKPTTRIPILPTVSAGVNSQRAASLSRNSRMRFGASMKSKACDVGGVSSTIRS